jgi:hypothetical protein
MTKFFCHFFVEYLRKMFHVSSYKLKELCQYQNSGIQKEEETEEGRITRSKN